MATISAVRSHFGRRRPSSSAEKCTHIRHVTFRLTPGFPTLDIGTRTCLVFRHDPRQPLTVLKASLSIVGISHFRDSTTFVLVEQCVFVND